MINSRHIDNKYRTWSHLRKWRQYHNSSHCSESHTCLSAIIYVPKNTNTTERRPHYSKYASDFKSMMKTMNEYKQYNSFSTNKYNIMIS